MMWTTKAVAAGSEPEILPDGCGARRAGELVERRQNRVEAAQRPTHGELMEQRKHESAKLPDRACDESRALPTASTIPRRSGRQASSKRWAGMRARDVTAARRTGSCSLRSRRRTMSVRTRSSADRLRRTCSR